MKTETTYGGPQGVDKPISHEAWSASVEPNSENVVVPLKKPKTKKTANSDSCLLTAKNLVVKNYNDHRNNRLAPISINEVNVVWFSQTIENWKVILNSPVARGLLWEVTSVEVRDPLKADIKKNEIHLDTYRKVHHFKTSTKEN